MEKLNSRPDHYHDTGEHAINRDFEDYRQIAFKDDSKDWLSEKPDEIDPNDPEKWSMRHFHSLSHTAPKEIEGRIVSINDNTIAYEWDWKENNIFGGLENFFAEGSKILDLGSGKGRAVQEINEQFRDKNLTCVGVDYRYAKEKPGTQNLVAGSFENLPFQNNSFDRILSIESFPVWLPKEETTIDKYIQEITRISKKDTLWRGTLPTYEFEDDVKFSNAILIKKFVEYGWEVFVSGNTFMAKLLLKFNS